MFKFLVFAGSTRKNSYNKKLAKLAEKSLRENNVDVTYLDLRDIPMPLYDGDLEAEQGIPENGIKFRNLLKCHHGFLIASPEYNSSISAVLKNAIDWASRPLAGDPPMVCFKGKVVSLISASPSRLGGLRGLVTVRSILGNIGCIVTPDQLCVFSADKAFDETGELIDKTQQKMLDTICKDFVSMTKRMCSQTELCVEATQAYVK